MRRPHASGRQSRGMWARYRGVWIEVSTWRRSMAKAKIARKRAVPTATSNVCPASSIHPAAMPRWTPGLSTVSRRDDHAAAAASGPAGRSGARLNGPSSSSSACRSCSTSKTTTCSPRARRWVAFMAAEAPDGRLIGSGRATIVAFVR